MLRRLSHLLVLLLTLFMLAVLGAGALRAATVDWNAFDWDAEYVPGGGVRDGMLLPGRLLVRFAAGSVPQQVLAKPGGGLVTGSAALDRAAWNIGMTGLEPLFAPAPPAKAPLGDPSRDLHYVATFDARGRSLREAAAELAGVPGVELVEPDPIHFFSAVLPDDPQLPNQWWLRSTQYGGGDIRAVAAWYYSTGSADVVVCAADSGTDWQHPDLGGTGPDYTDGVIWTNETEFNGIPGIDDDGNGKVDDIRGWDFVTNVPGTQSPPQDVDTPDNDPMDYDGHGTSVAGCMAAITDNGIGVASTNWSTKVMVCRIGWLPPDSDIGVVGMSFAAQSIDYARINGAHIYNASWGSSGIASLVTATNNAIAAGMIIVTAAGNDNDQEASYLASRGDVIAVAATTQSDNKSSFSSYGTWVDISAPGSTILTTGYNRSGSNGSQHTYVSPSGTSFASPIVAGAFAFAKAAYPNDSRSELIARVLAAVDDISAKNTNYIRQLGSGRLNLAKLFEYETFWTVPERLPAILDAMNIAAPGDTVALATSAVIGERLTLPTDKAMTILGAWNESFTSRDLINGLTPIIAPSGTGSLLKVLSGGGPGLVFDGFSIRGGRAGLVSFEPDDGFFGGGILIRDASPVLRNLRVTDNRAGEPGDYGAGGGIAVLGGSPVFENVVVEQNSARRGAGIYVHRGAPVFRNVRIADNTSYTTTSTDTPRGGGVYLLGAPSPTALVGGAVEVLFEDCVIENHSVTGTGGAIHAEDSVLRLLNCAVRSNQSTGSGAGLFQLRGSLTLAAVNVVGNAVVAGNLVSGGGLQATDAAIDIHACRFEGNTAGLGGGGLSVAGANALTLTQSWVVNNSSGVFGSGVLAQSMPQGTTIVGNTVADNLGASAGGNGLYLQGGSVLLERNIVAFNGGGGTSLADGIAVSNAVITPNCNVVFANFSGDWGGAADPTGLDGNLAEDPLFCLESEGYAIQIDSPAALADCGPMGAGAVGCGTVRIDDLPDDTPGARRQLALRQNAPNPFNPSTSIEFELPASGSIALRVFDLRGRLIRVLAEGDYAAGVHRVSWNGLDAMGQSVASGTYFYELRTSERLLIRKMGLLK